MVSSFLKSAREEKSGSPSSNLTFFELNMTINMPHSKKVEVPTWVPWFALEGGPLLRKQSFVIGLVV